MNLYVMRHGTTIWNEKGKTQGQVNNRLSKDGVEQALKTALEGSGIELDCIFTSPLLRAVQTANIVNKYHNVKVIKDQRITDIDQGYFTGKYFNLLTDIEKERKKNRDSKYGMESLESLYKRIKNFYEHINDKYKSLNILVVSHSGVIAMLEYVIKNNKFNEFDYSKISLLKNAEIKKII